ncbi:MAG TPA: 1,4-dihydroxy-2-naphthoate polyprenyltransferase [Opitutales bacterium]|jgi:1,4-dihydroxy-2-naphthoate octaprenyltransferase|nr:1,4-dihydroxy-2-naphthoate polyprenyltransferase [Opitutales bacterium]
MNPWLLAARPRTLLAGLAPVILGSALAAHLHHFQPIPALLCATFVICAQTGANFANDYFDHRHGADAPGRLGPVRVVASGLVSPTAMLAATFAILTLAAAVGCGLIYYGGWPTIAIGVASLLGALAYTGGPFPLAYHGLGEVTVVIYFGLVATLGTFYVQAGWPAPSLAWLAAVACGLLAANILLINNIRDRPADAAAAKRTLAVRFGRQFSSRLFGFNLVFAFLTSIIFYAIDQHIAYLLPLILVPLGLLLTRVLGAIADGDGPRFNKLLGFTAQFLALWSALFAVGLLF